MGKAKTAKTAKTHTFFKIFPVSLVLLLLPLVNVWGNVSESLRDSLLYESSGNYLWGMWDYQTNPYLYSHNQKNSLSFQITENTLFSLGSTFLIVSQPIYLGLQFSNKGSKEFEFNERPPGETTKDKKIGLGNVRAMVGTLPFVNLGFLKKMGVGVYTHWRRRTTEIFPKVIGGVTFRRKGDTIKSHDRNEYSVFSYGIEFGQTGGDENSNVSSGDFSYSAAIGYSDYGVGLEDFDENGVSQGKNDAPFLELGTDLSGYTKLFPNHLYFGPKKKEYTVNFLSWVVITPGINIGAAYNANYQPTLAGVDNSNDTRETRFPTGKVSEVSVDSLKNTAEIFLDLDSHIYSEKTSIGVFRLTPSLEFSSHSEKAEFDEELAGGTVKNEETFWRFKLAFKFYVFFDKAQTFRLVAGWAPYFDLSHEFTQEIEHFNIQVLLDTESKAFKYKTKKGFLDSDSSFLDSGRLGMEYSPVKDLALQLGMATSGENGFFNLSELSFGIDYAF